jgi:hypothetical protein
MTKYRFVCLLPHTYKMLSVTILLKLVKETEAFMPESQAGFRKDRGCRDNIHVHILVALMDFVLDEDEACVLTFLDYTWQPSIPCHTSSWMRRCGRLAPPTKAEGWSGRFTLRPLLS